MAEPQLSNGNVTGRWQNRIVGWEMVNPTQLLANPFNYRRHPGRQRDALRGSLDELGVIAPVVVNAVTGHVVDGHARIEEFITAGVQEIPAIYVELTPEQEKLALLALDPISAMAVSDVQALRELLDEVDTEDEGLQALLTDLQRAATVFDPSLFPEIANAYVTEEMVADADSRLGVATGEQDLREVTCPQCGEQFFID